MYAVYMLSLTSLLQAFEQTPVWGYWIVFLIAALESLAFVGIFVPGAIMIASAGFAAAQGYFDLEKLILFAALGAILGDGFSYWLGTKGTTLFHNERRWLKRSHLEKGERFFQKHGGKSVFLGRFISPIRPIVPFIAGISGMNVWHFLFWNITSAFGWSLLYVLLGYFFGQAWQVIGTWSARIGIGITAFVIIIFIIVVIRNRK